MVKVLLMKTFSLLSLVCYIVLALLPLPFSKNSPSTPLEKVPAATPVTESEEKKDETPAAVFKVLDTAGSAIYSFSERDFLIYTVAAEMPASLAASMFAPRKINSHPCFSC